MNKYYKIMANLSDIVTENFSTTKLIDRPFDWCVKFNNKGRIVEEFKYKINDPTLNIQNSKFIGNPEDKFETMLFLPNNHERKGEGGLRTKGYFKHSYKYIKSDCKNNNEIIPDENKIETGDWYIIDSNDKPLKLASTEIQQKIANYISNIKVEKDNSIKTTTPENIVYLPLISVITVVYNGAKYLEKTILSILNQSYPNIEYIIIDGGSTDDTLDIIKKYENYIDYWISEPDNGIYDAMNKGINLALGQWIYFLGSDDICFNVIHRIIGRLCIKFDAFYGDVYMKKKKIIYDGKFNKYKLMLKNICHQAIFYNSTIFKKRRFNVKYNILADYEFNLSNFLEKKWLYLPLLICRYNDSDGISANNKDFLFNKEKAEIIKHSFGYLYYLIFISRKIVVQILDLFNLKGYIKKVLN